MSQTDKGIDDLPEDEGEGTEDEGGDTAAEEHTNLLTMAGTKESLTEAAANGTEDSQPAEENRNDGDLSPDSDTKTERDTTEYEAGASDTGIGAGTPASMNADQKLNTVTEEEYPRTEQENLNVQTDHSDAPDGEQDEHDGEQVEKKESQRSAAREAERDRRQKIDEEEMKREEREKEIKAAHKRNEELQTEIRRKAMEEKTKFEDELKSAVPVGQFRDVTYDSGGLAMRNEEILEAESDLAKAFAEQIGLYDEDSLGSDEEEEEGEAWEEEPIIRDANLLISQPSIAEGSKFPQNLLEFRHSFGFDCLSRYNLCVLDPDTIVVTAGNMLFFFKVSTGTVTFRRSASGQGLGFIAKHPHLPHFAVGEKGTEPYIIIYEWATMTLVALLRHGTRRSYAHLEYSPTGELLYSQGGSPDYLFTVWNWKKEKKLLRTRSANTDVLNARFSLYLPGHITTAGMGHIKFWKMCKTFTGLKLKGETGRFGKTEISDVLGIYAMPDEKVVSGCDWGNILVWEAGLIKFEVTRKNRLKCHDGPITQFEFQNGELMSAGKDGFIKSWYYETIDLADPPDDDRFVEVEPMFELEVADHLGPASIISMARVDPTLKGDTSWYAQDGNGGIWLLNLAMTANATPPKRLYVCHSGHVVGLQISPISEHFASIDNQGKLHLWDLNTNQLLGIKATPFPGSSLLWLPENVAPCGCVLLAGLSDGGVRAYAINIADASQSAKSVILDTSSERLFTLIQFIKPHTGPVLYMDINVTNKYILTVSSDLTAFVFALKTVGQFCNLVPVGFSRIPSAPSFLRKNGRRPNVFYIGCKKGEVVEFTVPEHPTHNVDVSYEFTEPTSRILQTKSIKSQIIRDAFLEEQKKRKDEKLEEKREKLEELKKENPGLDIDEEQFLADSEPEEELPPLYIPEEPSPVNIISSTKDQDTVLVTLGGYDCGYIYMYRFGQEDPVQSAKYLQTGDEEVCVGLINASRTLMYVGLGDGRIIVGAVREEIGPTDDVWSLGMHHGRVDRLTLSRNEDYIISTGEDVNIFAYKVNVPPQYQSLRKPTVTLTKFVPPPAANDAYSLSEPSLEQASGKKESDRRTKEASGKKSQVEHDLFNIAEQYNKLKRRNRALPKSQMIPRKEMELDARVIEDRQRSIAEEADFVRQQHEYNLEKARLRFRKLENFLTGPLTRDFLVVDGFRKNVSVRTLRYSSCHSSERFKLAKLALERKLREDAIKIKEISLEGESGRRGFDMDLEVEETEIYVPTLPTPAESFLRGISAFEHRFTSRLRRLLEKYQSRAAKKERRKIEWAVFLSKKPDVNKNDPEDEARIAEAEQTIGDYKLKSDSKYKVPKHLISTTVSKCQELLDVREKIDDAVGRFNDALEELHNKKLTLISTLHNQVSKLKRIHEELKPNLHKAIPDVPSLSDAKDSNKTAHLRFTEAAVAEERDKISSKKKPGEHGKKVDEPESYYMKDPLAENIFAFGLQLVYPEHFLRVTECEDVSGEIPDMHLINATTVELSTLIELSQRDDVTTPYEKELRLKRVLRRTWEQDSILKNMAQSIVEFDNEVEKTSEKRWIAMRESFLIHQRLITLTQELDIIKASESREEFLMSRVTEKQLEKKAMQQQIAHIQSRLETRYKGILRCQDKQKQTLSLFLEAVGESPFKDYLRRIFKKKYKPPRNEDETSSESSSSTSSEEEEDADTESVDSKELQRVRFDENVCPSGCPRELYDLTFTLRSERHDAEKEMSELQKASEILKREQESWNKKLKIIEKGLEDNLDDLDLFQREKQQRLNEVDTIVVIRLSQMRHVKPDGTFIPMKDTLVFDTTMLSYLGKRVGLLNIEANEERERHRKNRRHLYRMVKDVHYMENRLKTLKEGIIEAQYNKFGQLVKLEELETALLRRYIYEIRLNAAEIKKEFQGLIQSIQETVRDRYRALVESVENNTDLQNLLLTLTEERNKLFLRTESNKVTLTRSATGKITEEEFEEDIDKLRKLLKGMTDKRNKLLQDLVRLRQKGTAPAAVHAMQSMAESEVDPEPPGYHARCVPEMMPKRPPWPPRVIPGFDKLRSSGVLQAPEKPPTPPESPIVDMWERLLQDMGVEDQTYWPDHTDPTKKHKLHVESIGEGFVFQTLHDLPPVNEEEVLAANYIRDDTAPLFTVVGDKVQVVGQPDDGTEVPDDAGSLEMDEYNGEKVESTTELFQRVPSTEVEGAIGSLIDVLSTSSEERESRKGQTTSMDGSHRKLSRSSTQTRQSRSNSQTSQPRSNSQTRQPHSNSQMRQPRSSSQTRQPGSSSQTRQPGSSSQTGQPRSNSQTGQPRSNSQTGQPRSSSQTGQPRSSSQDRQSGEDQS